MQAPMETTPLECQLKLLQMISFKDITATYYLLLPETATFVSSQISASLAAVLLLLSDGICFT